MKGKNERKIREGLIGLLEKRLGVLEEAVEKGGEIWAEARNVLEIERIAEDEGYNISDYKDGYFSLINKYWEKHKAEAQLLR
ncbi:Uncharacterised protein [uncultured archaeon]|nr:Uncharacterised protein [uncultured archaeon]